MNNLVIRIRDEHFLFFSLGIRVLKMDSLYIFLVNFSFLKYLLFIYFIAMNYVPIYE